MATFDNLVGMYGIRVCEVYVDTFTPKEVMDELVPIAGVQWGWATNPNDLTEPDEPIFHLEDLDNFEPLLTALRERRISHVYRFIGEWVPQEDDPIDIHMEAP